MNKSEKYAIAGLIASWTWNQTTSGAEAVAYGRAANQLQKAFEIPADILNFSHAWEIAKLKNIHNNERLFDTLVDLIDDKGLAYVSDLVEQNELLPVLEDEATKAELLP